MKKGKLSFIIISGVIAMWLLIGIIDFSLVHNYKKPVFCIGVNTADDGGSGTYKGLGYSFELEGNFMLESENPGVTSYRGYIFGKEVSRGFWEKQVWSEEDKDKLIYGYQVDDTGKTLNSSEMKKYYIEFAMDNRIDFIPNFDENTYKANETVSTEDFLMLTYYMNKDNLSEDLSMNDELVEKVMRENFGIEKVEHRSQFKGWTYVEEENKYTPYPEGTAEDGIFDVISFNSYKENDKKIYDVTLREYRFPFIFDKDDSALSNVYSFLVKYTEDEENVYRENVLFLLAEKGEEIKNAETNIYNAFYNLIVEDNTDGFTVGKTIRIKYYIDETTGKPRFIYKSEELSDFIFAEKYDEVFYEKKPDESYGTRFVLVRVGDYWGIVNGRNGKEILKPNTYKLNKIRINTYEEVCPVIEVEKDGKYGMIDYYGNMVIEPKWEKVWMDVYNVPNVVFVYDGEKWGGIRLTFDNYKNQYEYSNLKASEVDYETELSKELPIIE